MDASSMLEVAALSLDALALGLCVREVIRARRLLGELRAAPELELDSRLQDRAPLPYVAVRGAVKPLGDPVKGTSDPKIKGVVQKISMREHVVARSAAGFWADESRTVYELCNVAPFVLTAPRINLGISPQIEVLDPLEAQILDMDIISDKFEPLTPSLLDHIWGYISGIRQKGMQTTEEMLREGTTITAIGELNIGNNGGLTIQPPKDGLPMFLVTSTKSSLIKKITDSKDLLRILIMVFGSVAVFLGSRMLIRYFKHKKKLREDEDLKTRLAVSRKERRQLAREKNLSEVQLCVVCAENPKEIILLPCGHVCLCEDCSDNIAQRCPVCRIEIQSKAPAFIT